MFIQIFKTLPEAKPQLLVYGLQRLDRLTITEIDAAELADLSDYVRAVDAIPEAGRNAIQPLPGVVGSDPSKPVTAEFIVSNPDSNF